MYVAVDISSSKAQKKGAIHRWTKGLLPSMDHTFQNVGNHFYNGKKGGPKRKGPFLLFRDRSISRGGGHDPGPERQADLALAVGCSITMATQSNGCNCLVGHHSDKWSTVHPGLITAVPSSPLPSFMCGFHCDLGSSS